MRPLVLGCVVLVASTSACSEPTAAVDAGDEPVDARSGPAHADVEAVAIAAAVKGAPLAVTITVRNDGGAGTVRLTPRVTSARFAEFVDVPLGTVEVALAAGATTEATLSAGPFLDDDGGRYALGRGDYTVTAVQVVLDGAPWPDDVAFTGAAFAVAASPAVFDVVLYDQAYFDDIGWTDTPEAYVRGAYRRASELFTPSSPGSSTGAYQAHAGGFDEMMAIEHQVLALPGLTASDGAGGFCEQVTAYAHGALGLTRDWDVDEGQPSWTDVDHHGFDVLVGLTPAMGGGAACGWLGVQVSGLFSFDLSLDRSQIILVHETGHLFGAPHCDPLQGYVMCAGEQHAHYQDDGRFVWHQVSRDAMANHWQ